MGRFHKVKKMPVCDNLNRTLIFFVYVFKKMITFVVLKTKDLYEKALKLNWALS